MSTKITVTIETDNGNAILTLKGEENGGNPRYNAQNVERGLAKIGERVRGMYDSMYGDQY